MRYILTATSTVAILLTGCTMGPKYQGPAVTAPSTFRDAPASSAESLGDAQWWTVFQDEELQKLIRTALAENHAETVREVQHAV